MRYWCLAVAVALCLTLAHGCNTAKEMESYNDLHFDLCGELDVSGVTCDGGTDVYAAVKVEKKESCDDAKWYPTVAVVADSSAQLNLISTWRTSVIGLSTQCFGSMGATKAKEFNASDPSHNGPFGSGNGVLDYGWTSYTSLGSNMAECPSVSSGGCSTESDLMATSDATQADTLYLRFHFACTCTTAFSSAARTKLKVYAWGGECKFVSGTDPTTVCNDLSTATTAAGDGTGCERAVQVGGTTAAETETSTSPPRLSAVLAWALMLPAAALAISSR